MTMQHERSRALGGTLPKNVAADPDAQRLHALLELAYLAASVDGKLADDEIELLVANLQAWLGEQLETRLLIELFDHFGERLATEGLQGRVDAIAAILDAESRRIAYKLACVTALCDQELHEEELRFLEGVVHAFGIPNDEAQTVFDELDEAISTLS